MKRIIGVLLLSVLLIGGCARRETPVIQEAQAEDSGSLLEETKTEDQDKKNDINEEENLSIEAEDNPSKEASIEEVNPEEADKNSSLEKVEENTANPSSQPEAGKKVENKETSTQAELLKKPETKAPVKPVSETPSAPAPQPAPAPVPEPEVIVVPDVMVVLSDGTGQNYKTFMGGVNGKLTFDVTTTEHESVAQDVIISMTTPPGTYKEGTVVKILVSSGKPAAAVVDTYAISYLGDVETEIVRLVNEYRVANGLNALEVRADLNKSARYKSGAMIEHNYFSHDNPQDGNASFSGLMRNIFKYNHYTSFGENLAAQYGTSTKGSAEKFFLQWKNSDGHNRNMLDPSWKYMGIGVAYTSKAGSTFNNYAATLATQHFAR